MIGGINGVGANHAEKQLQLPPMIKTPKEGRIAERNPHNFMIHTQNLTSQLHGNQGNAPVTPVSGGGGQLLIGGTTGGGLRSAYHQQA